MTQGELLIHYGWLIALVVATGVISWSVLLLQALFHDRRIAFIGVFGSLLVAFIAVFPEMVPYAGVFKVLTAFVCLVFIAGSLFNNIKKPHVYLASMGVLVSASVGYWLYQSYQLAA